MRCRALRQHEKRGIPKMSVQTSPPSPAQRSKTQLNIRFLADFSEDDAVQAGEVPDVPEERCCV